MFVKAYLKIPNSQQGERSERKVYVSYHNQEITVEDLRIHFEKYGDVEDVFIPTPWKHFCFVTFCEKRVANALIGKEHTLKVYKSMMITVKIFMKFFLIL